MVVTRFDDSALSEVEARDASLSSQAGGPMVAPNNGSQEPAQVMPGPRPGLALPDYEKEQAERVAKAKLHGMAPPPPWPLGGESGSELCVEVEAAPPAAQGHTPNSSRFSFY